MKKKREKTTKTSDKFYVNNKELYEELVKYKAKAKENEKEGKDKPPISNYLGECFLKIATEFSNYYRFRNYSYKDELIADAVENCLMYFDRFDPEKTNNPFTYFTTIVYYAMMRRVNKENKQQYLKYKMLEKSNVLENLTSEDIDSFSEEVRKNVLNGSGIYDNMSQFIENYETWVNEKKAKNKEKRDLQKIELEKELEKELDKDE